MAWRTKIRPTDTMFSGYIRDLHEWTCERCGRQHEWGSKGLQASHFFGRSNEAVRFDEELNIDCLCSGCHSYFHRNPNVYVDWKKWKLGEENYKKLLIRANQKVKKDDKLTMIILKKKISELKRIKI